MLKEDLILRNPLRMMGFNTDEILPDGGFGAVLARAGVGKTSLLVQLALNTLLHGNNILHISLNDQVEKVSLWYKEVFHKLADQHENYSPKTVRLLWEEILPQRFIMTLNGNDFSVAKLEDKLSELRKQNIFLPKMLLVDGLPFDDRAMKESLSEFKAFTLKNGMFAWFSVRTHRHEAPGPNGMPPQMNGIDDMFDIILQLQPDDKDIHVKTLKGESEGTEIKSLLLDPSSLLVQKR